MFQLNLRQKMLCGFILQLVFFAGLGGSVFRDFEKFNLDVKLLIHSIKLSNIYLEIRRYEKNFIIRQSEGNYRIAEKYGMEASDYLAVMRHDLTRASAEQEYLEEMNTKLTEYQAAFRKLKAECDNCLDSESPSTIESRYAVQERGRELITLSDELVVFEQNKLSQFIQHFKIQISIYLLVLIVFTVLTFVMLFKSFVNPLKRIEEAANAIAKGTFTPLPLPDIKDELHSVIRAFHKMVNELERQQEQLFQAKKLSSIGTLASGTAHQLNNPLNNISTSCQIALAELKDGDCQFIEGLLKNIEQETRRASETVKGLLEFSRVQTFSLQPVLLEEVTANAIRLVSSDVPADISITRNITPGLTLNLDVQKMTEALLNLLFNSIQSITPPGSISIEARTDSEEQHAVITIKDTGSGIDEKDIHKIFDPFYTTKKVGEGTGLGLAIVYGIIKKHNGTIRVESTRGMGSEFIITLPLCHEKARPLQLQNDLQ